MARATQRTVLIECDMPDCEAQSPVAAAVEDKWEKFTAVVGDTGKFRRHFEICPIHTYEQVTEILFARRPFTG